MLRKIISGGQTGADRAGLDFAIKVELSSNSYPVRTKRNIRESDGTVIFSLDKTITGGSAFNVILRP